VPPMADRSATPARVTTADGVEIELAWSAAAEPRAAAVVTHPHPLMGGDMHNPVPAGVARGLAAAGVTAVRLSFREFMRTGVPVAVGSLLVATAYLASYALLGSQRAPMVMGALAGLGLLWVWRSERA